MNNRYYKDESELTIHRNLFDELRGDGLGDSTKEEDFQKKLPPPQVRLRASNQNTIFFGLDVSDSTQYNEEVLIIEQVVAKAVSTAIESALRPIQRKLDLIANRLNEISGLVSEESIRVVETEDLRDIPREQVKAEIEELFQATDREHLFYSDIAEILLIDLELVVGVCDELIREGKIR